MQHEPPHDPHLRSETWHPIDDATLTYIAANGRSATRHARVWERPGTGERYCVVTERPDDEGPSITDAAADVTATAQVWWGPACTVIEHHPASGPDNPEHFDAVDVNARGEATWRRLDADALAAALPDLPAAATTHTGPEGNRDDA
ncbi:hypothetical protein LO763_19520 [Glycomyces sp. A-F 0318]|uniref:hypothetical protein n=1 Tax=Glycomyces amatae TaxID=2881355 RepID=UPI001E5824F8|nr:hypothetical protein [Glycomyces amatae]MCD0445801.1 hypothetical protein [Glycomyces amatae]